MIRKGISVVFLVLLLFLALIGVFVCVTLAIRWTKRQTGDFVAAASEAIAIVGEGVRRVKYVLRQGGK